MKKINGILNGKESFWPSLFIVSIAIFILYIITYATAFDEAEHGVEAIMALAVIICGMLLIFSKSGRSQMRKDEEQRLLYALQIVLIAGLIMRIGYMLYTPVLVRGHDYYGYKLTGNDHSAYIMSIFNGRLPKNRMGQFYHPPLYYMLSAILCRLSNLILKEGDINRMLEGAKLISCVASCGILMMTREICRELKLKGRAQLITVAFVAFSPQFFLLAGRANNDSVAMFFMVLIILYLLRFWHKPSKKNLVFIALGFGLGMMTKMSVAVLAFPVAPVLLIRIFGKLRDKDSALTQKDNNGTPILGKIDRTTNRRARTVITDFLLFSGIAFPLGLWYPIRNFLKFGQSFTYVLDPGGVESTLYVGNYSLVERFFSFQFSRLLTPAYDMPFDDYNAPVYLVKGALFGEFSMWIPEVFAAIFTVIWCVLVLLVLVSFGTAIVKAEEKAMFRYILPGIAVTIMASYMFFNIGFPYGCTMDFRYISEILVLSGVFLGKGYEILCEGRGRASRHLKKLFSIVTAVFCVYSMLFYCVL